MWFIYVCMYVHTYARGRHEKKNFEAKYIIQRNTEYWGGKKSLVIRSNLL